MKYINHIQRTAILLVLLLAGWAAGVPLSAQTVVEVIPDPATNLAGTDNGSNMQPLDSLMVADYGITFRFYTGNGSTAPAYYDNGKAIRLYNGNMFSVHSDGTYTIDGIEFPSSYSSSNETTLLYEVGVLGYDAETNTYIWINESGVSDANFAIQKTQLRLPSIRLTLTANGETVVRPKAPVLSQKSCDFYAPFELTINDMNDPAATVRYTLDGSEPGADNGETYTGPFTIPAGADVTVKAVAVNDNGVSAVTSATYHFVPKHLLTLRLPNKGGVSYVYYSSSNEYGEWQGKDGSAYITEGDQVSIGYYLNSGYSCKSIMLDGERQPLTGDWFNFTMPSKDVELVIETMFNPSSPGDPQPGDTTRTYNLKLVVNPLGAGSLSSDTGRYAAGTSVYVSAYNSTGYVFTGWTKDGETISTHSSMNYTMPASDVVLTANYVFNPSSPKDPDQPALKHPLTAVASPSGSASFNLSAQEVTFGENYYVYVYPNDGYRLKGWIVNGVAQESTTSPLTGTMTDAGAHVVALMVFDPSSPANPGANYYNPTTGQVIIDDFRSDNLYSALRQTVGSSDYENVSSIIVKGLMTYSDYNCLSYLKNATTIDVSRTGGSTELPGYTFQNLGVANVAVSSTITEFGSYVFSGCANLSSLTVYAQEPPRCSSSTFSGFTNKANCTVYVPASAIELYSNADYWKDFTILPITNDAHVMQVNLPQDAADGRYKHNSLEIVNINTGVRQKYVISDRLLYTFNGLQKDEQYNIYMYSQAGLEIGRIENVVIPDQDFEVTFDSLKALYNVEAKVLASDGSDVTSQVTVEWLKPLADGTVTYLRKAVSLGEVPEGQQLICRVTLDSKLGVVYAAPGDAEFTVSDGDNTFAVTLTPFRSIALSGKVTDGDGAVLQGASVSVNQTLNGKYSRTFTAKTDGSGLWNLSVLDAPETRVTYAAAECVNLTDTIGAFDADISALDLGQKALRSIVGARVTYGFTYRAAGAEEAEQHYADYQNVAVSVYNVTQGRAHSDLSLQYPVLAVLDENINTGDELRLTATSKTGAFNPIERTVTVGDNQRAEVTFDIVGKGGIAASFEMTDNPAVTAMLYSAKGELLKKMTYAETKATFTELEDGEYTLVSMGQSDLMNSILRLSNFDEIGLTEGKDYVKNTVTVETGKLAEIRIGEVPAFDESLFYYTTSMTGFSSNKSSITTGNYLTLRSAIDFKGVYKNDISNVALVVDLPEACDLVDQSVIQGPNLLPYTLDGKRLTVQLGNNYASQTRFCVIPTSGGTFNATASITFDYNGKTLTQPIGTATSEIKDIEIVVPSSTAKENFRVSGTARGHAAVSVYVDGTLASQTKANAAGHWTTECALDAPENFSSHTVYAEFVAESGPKLESETRTIVFNPYDVHVENVEMTFFNGWNRRQYSVIWDFEDGTVSASKYDFYTTTDMTFLVRIAYNDVKLLPFVWLHVFTSDGSVRSLRADYNAEKDCWVAVDQFSSNALPTRCSVTVENMMFDIAAEADYNLLMDQYVGDINLKDTVTNDDGSTTSEYVDGNGDDVAAVDSYETDESFEDVVDKFKQDGYEEDETLNDDSDYEPEDEDDTLDSDTKVLTKDEGNKVVFIRRGRLTTEVVVIRLICEEGRTSSTDRVSSVITNEWRSFYRKYFDEAACAEVTEYIRHTEHLDKYVTIITSTLVAHTIYINVKLVPPGTKIPGKQVLAKIRRIRHSSKRYTTETMEYAVVPKDCKPKPPTPPTPPTPPVDPILDPSGFVYEAVPENRVEGVQASIYYKETKEDMYGDPYEEIVLWDAEEYAQKNPLFTDENGMYQWDVPQGLWQVKFEKDGYVTAYSEWLPVPPPQLDVNVAITQNKQPEVTEARAYEEGVEVQFDKYMDLSTLTTDNIYVTAAGEKLGGEIRMVDSALADEYASEDDADATRYASRIRFVPEEPLSATTGEVRVTVSRNVLSYAGIPMTETFSQVLDVEKEVQMIVADDMKVLYGGEKELTVYALPYDAAVGRTLRIANSSDLIASVDITEAVLDDEGKAVVTVRGELPGSAQLSFTIDDVTATGACAVDVLTEIITAEMPKASRASGTAVYRGTKIELTTESKDATIYFTTDGSCPCDENGTRRKYTVPVVIDGDMRILAVTSVGNGNDDISETAEFNYTLKRSDMDFRMDEGWTWISHNFENAVAAADLAADENVSRILSQTQEVVRDPELGMTGTLTALSAQESYKVETTAPTGRVRMSDVALNPAIPISLTAGWNWLGYPVDQTMSVDEAFASTEIETLDVIVGQNGFAQYDGEKWTGTLETMSPGMGYMYQSRSAKDVVYNTSIVSTASAKYTPGISTGLPFVLDIHKYASVMPVVASLTTADGAALDCADYQVAAFCGSECRAIGRTVDGMVMMNVYGNAGDPITFTVADIDGERFFDNSASLKFSEDIVGDVFTPYDITLNDLSGMAGVTYDGNIRVTVDGDILRINGIAPDDIDFVEIYDMDGRKLLRATGITDSGVTVRGMISGVYIVIVNASGEYSYHKIALR